MEIALIPQPHRLAVQKGFFKIPAKGTIGISSGNLYRVAQDAVPIFKNHAIHAAVNGVSDSLTMTLRSGLKSGGYRIRIGRQNVFIEADSVAAACNAVRTLRQIAAQSQAQRLPLLRIDDWPDFVDRGLYYDMCRGRVPKLESLFRQIDLLAAYKINHVQFYIEHTFRFRGRPDIGRGASPLDAEEILKLDAYCRERHIELVPSLASFGHLANVLKHKQYRHLAEDWGRGKYVAPDAKIPASCPKGWTLSPANPGTYTFLDSLFAEFLPLFTSDRFNICCDETWDLGAGQSYELCKKRGKGRVYLDHIVKLNNICKKYNKRIMFWGDIIRKHPELIPEIPPDVTVLDWGYDHNRDFASIRDFKNAGLEFLACPGTSSWSSLFPRLHEATANIHGFAVAGKRNEARGLLNTDWGDGGHYNFMEFSWHGYLFGAEQAWNVNADIGTFTERFLKLFLGAYNGALAKAMETLGDITHLCVDGYYQSAWQHIFFATPGHPLFMPQKRGAWICRNGLIQRGDVALDAELGRVTVRKLDGIRSALAKCAKSSATDPHGVLPYWLFAVDTLAHAARKLTVFGAGGKDTLDARRALKNDMIRLRKRFEALWHKRNRPSEIRITLNRYRKAIRAVEFGNSVCIKPSGDRQKKFSGIV